MSYPAVFPSFLFSILAGSVTVWSQTSTLASFEIDYDGSNYTAQEPDPLDDLTTLGSLVRPSYGRDAFDNPTNTIVNPVGFAAGNWQIIGSAQANAQPDGTVAARSNAFGSEGGMIRELRAHASWSATVSNLSGVDQAYTFDFHIDAGGFLAATDYAYLSPDGDVMEAAYAINIRLNGVSVWSSGALLKVGELGGWHDLTLSGTELGRTFTEFTWDGSLIPYDVSVDWGMEGDSGIGYVFDGLDESLLLGTFGDGESFTVTYEMTTEVRGPLAETGAMAAFGDPLNLGSGPGMSGAVEPTTVVIPEARLFLPLGLLACLTALLRRAR